VSLIEKDSKEFRNKTQAKQGEKTFFEWLEEVGLEKEGFDSVVRSDKIYKGKPVTFYISSYGYFQVEDGWVVYISYRGDVVNHIRYHTWKWSLGIAQSSSYKLNEWLNI
jgi:hypothetical protein